MRSDLNGDGGRRALVSAAGQVRVADSYPIYRSTINPLLPLRDAWFFFTRHLTTLVPLCLPWIFLESLPQQQIDKAVGPQQMGAWSLVTGLLSHPPYATAPILFMDAHRHDERSHVGQLWSAALRLWPAPVLFVALISLPIVLGLSLLILPGTFVMVKLSFAEFCLMLRGRSPLQALRESFGFIHGRLFLILVCSLMILLPVWSLRAWLADLAGDAVMLRVALHILSGFFQLLLTTVTFRIYSLGPAPRNGMWTAPCADSPRWSIFDEPCLEKQTMGGKLVNPSYISHLSTGTNGFSHAQAFYDAVMAVLGCKVILEYPGAVTYGKLCPEFWVQMPIDGRLISVDDGSHVGFFADSKVQVDAFHAATLAAGADDENAPDPRLLYGESYYGYFIRDFDGHKVEASYWDVNQDFNVHDHAY